MARKKKHRPHRHTEMKSQATDRRIVLIDDAPLRNRETKECSRAKEKLEKARAELRQYEQKDKPGYERWLAQTFGALLTELRENAMRIQEQGMLIHEVEYEMMRSGHRNPRKAYAAVMARRANADMGEDEDFAEEGDVDDDWDVDFDSPPFADLGKKVSEKEKRALFEELVKESFGLNPKKLPKEVYDELYEDFTAHAFGTGAEGRQAFKPAAKEAPEEAPEANRIKEIYRILVRRLHPDTRADGDATASALWHDVQQAYEAGHLDRLETLLALTEMEEGSGNPRMSLHQMRAALRELNRALRAIQKSLTVARRDFAWGFARTPYHGELERRIRRDMQGDLSNQRALLADFKQLLDDWSQPWNPPRKKKKRERSIPQDEFQPELFPF
jgi:hypothetical protein